MVSGNTTNTTFETRAIVVHQQSLREDEPSKSDLISKQITSLNSQNDKKRREALTYLKNLPVAELSDAIQTEGLLPKLLQLTLVVNHQVRREAVVVLSLIPPEQAAEYVEQMLPFVRAGLTHLAANIAATSLELLDWLIKSCGEQLVSCRGGWVKTLKCFLVMLRWTSEAKTSGWVFNRSSVGKQASSLARCLQVLAAFLETGLRRPKEDCAKVPIFPIVSTLGTISPTATATTFSYLDLFGEVPDNDNAECNDVDTRKRVVAESFQIPLGKGLAALLEDGGHVGAAAWQAVENLQMGMTDTLGYDAGVPGDGTGDSGEEAVQHKGKGKASSI
ncbi:rRNA processing protein [Pseudocyphellaria aurata]|nr:rRNA processing protein [Pseudocyphellaria aurata]